MAASVHAAVAASTVAMDNIRLIMRVSLASYFDGSPPTSTQWSVGRGNIGR